MAPGARPIALAVTAACAAGCGDPVADGAYDGESLLDVHGLVCAVGELATPGPAIGIAWTRIAPASIALSPGETQPIDARDLPAEFRLRLFADPPGDAGTTMIGPRGPQGVHVGIPLLFDDRDGDGAWGPADALLGAARRQVVIRATEITSDMPSSQLHVAAADTYQLAEVLCGPDDTTLVGFDVVPSDTRVEIWLLDGVIENSIEDLAPATCLWPFGAQ